MEQIINSLNINFDKCDFITHRYSTIFNKTTLECNDKMVSYFIKLILNTETPLHLDDKMEHYLYKQINFNERSYCNIDGLFLMLLLSFFVVVLLSGKL
jgi:hypothetical protein